MDQIELSGSCLCGFVKYRIEGQPVAMYHCHCGRCRKANGTGHASNIRITDANLKWLAGEEFVRSYKVPEAERFRNVFCGNCGSPLPRNFPEHGFIVLPAGTLDIPAPELPTSRIFYSSRTSWSCQDDLPAFDRYPT